MIKKNINFKSKNYTQFNTFFKICFARYLFRNYKFKNPYLHMCIECTRLRKRLPTSNANVRPLPRMHPHMPQQNRINRKPSSANGTNVRPLPRMVPHVILELHDGREAFLADGALDGLFGAVQALVAGQVARLTERLAAEVADEGALVGVSAHVDFEAGFRDVAVFANFASEWTFTWNVFFFCLFG